VTCFFEENMELSLRLIRIHADINSLLALKVCRL